MIGNNAFMSIQLIDDTNGIYYDQLLIQMRLQCNMYRAETVKSFNDCVDSNYVAIDANGFVTLTDSGTAAKSEYINNKIHSLKLRSTAF